MNKPISLWFFLFLIITVIMDAGYTFWVGQVNAQNQSSDDIADRSRLMSVPVKHVTTIRWIPYEIEIVLQNSSVNDRITVDDNWFMQLTKREAKLAYRISPVK